MVDPRADSFFFSDRPTDQPPALQFPHRSRLLTIRILSRLTVGETFVASQEAGGKALSQLRAGNRDHPPDVSVDHDDFSTTTLLSSSSSAASSLVGHSRCCCFRSFSISCPEFRPLRRPLRDLFLARLDSLRSSHQSRDVPVHGSDGSEPRSALVPTFVLVRAASSSTKSSFSSSSGRVRLFFPLLLLLLLLLPPFSSGFHHRLRRSEQPSDDETNSRRRSHELHLDRREWAPPPLPSGSGGPHSRSQYLCFE